MAPLSQSASVLREFGEEAIGVRSQLRSQRGSKTFMRFDEIPQSENSEGTLEIGLERFNGMRDQWKCRRITVVREAPGADQLVFAEESAELEIDALIFDPDLG
jgi:hypothetical protein